MEEVNLETNEIKLTLGDWLYNAGIVGFLNVLKHSGDESKYRLDGQNAYFNIEVLEGFEEKYFKYLIDTYEKTMIYSTVSKLLEQLIFLYNQEVLEEKVIEVNTKKLKDKLKNSAYEELRDCIKIEDLKKITNENKASNLDILAQLNNYLLNAENKYKIIKKEIVGYYDQQSKMSKSPNAIADKYINTNTLDIIKLSKDIEKYLLEDKSKFDFNCFTCNEKIKKIESGLSFINNMFFDTSRKTSHIWNLYSDIEICPICRLVYYCIPLGFSTIYGNGIFINENQNIQRTLNLNNKVKMKILKDEQSNNKITYKAIITTLEESVNDLSKYELSDIQVVRLEDNKYRFNILSKQLLKILFNSKKDLNSILNVGFTDKNDENHRIYDEVMRKLLNNENLFSIINNLLLLEISPPKKKWFHLVHIKNVMKINYEYLKGVGAMNSNEKDILKTYSGAGFYLKKAYKDKSSDNKLNGISYRLLNALKTNNQGMFMDTVLNCYLYTGKQIPSFFTDCLKEIELFKTIGYAFVSGLMDGEIKEEKTNGGNE